MIIPICLACRQQRLTFRTELKYCTCEVDGNPIRFLEPRAYCIDCGEELWVDEYDEIHIRSYEETVERMMEAKKNALTNRKAD